MRKRRFFAALIVMGILVFGFHLDKAAAEGKREKGSMMEKGNRGLKTAVFAGGCFWCVESDFEKVDGVVEVVSGYAGGNKEDPTYEEVSSGSTGHVESVRVFYDPEKVPYDALLDVFWRHVDPTDPGGQFIDRGSQYRSVIFYDSDGQKEKAEESKRALEKSGRFRKPIVTEIRPLGSFYRAEEYHQDYYKTHALKYRFYRHSSGRDQFLQKAWGHEKAASPVSSTGTTFVKPGEEELRKRLTPLQYKVARRGGTEPPFSNEYWNNKEEGIYVDIVSGEPLFSSTDKFDSGTGWPSFTRPLEPENVVEKQDRSLFMVRTEVRSRHGNSHLGHVFQDGPPATGLRYCINSAALRFIPKEDLEREGYGKYLGLFSETK